MGICKPVTEFHRSASWRRRDFLRASAQSVTAVTLANTIPIRAIKAFDDHSSFRRMTGAETSNHLADAALMEQLVLRAVEAARSAGARYAEARVTRSVSQAIASESPSKDGEYLAIGVRALVGGAWGFAASTYWELDEASVLAREAVEQARINASIFPGDVDLGTYPVAKGSWSTPIRIDPFQISLEQKIDFIRSFDGLVPRHVSGRKFGADLSKVGVSRQERMVATSENALFSQTCYQTGGEFRVSVKADIPGTRNTTQASALGRDIETAGAGWELFLDAKLREQIPGLIEEAESQLFIPHKPIDVGLYEVVMPASVLGSFVAVTLGNATQLDRAVGLEANAGGTSYLGPDPADHLGTQLGSSLLNVSGNRSQPKGLATVKWDDEGVEPETFPIIENGVVADYQTTREQAAWLSSWYQSRQRPVRSHGCALAPAAAEFPLQHTPNLEVKPGAGTVTFEEMIQNTSRGIAFVGGGVSTDFQSRTGAGGGMMREIVNGKLGPILDGAQVLFDSTQVWKNLIELGGANSGATIWGKSIKGQPTQVSFYSLQSVAGRFKEMTIVDAQRK